MLRGVFLATFRGSQGPRRIILVCKLRKKITYEEYRHGKSVKMVCPLVLGEKPSPTTCFCVIFTLDDPHTFLRCTTRTPSRYSESPSNSASNGTIRNARGAPKKVSEWFECEWGTPKTARNRPVAANLLLVRKHPVREQWPALFLVDQQTASIRKLVIADMPRIETSSK